MNRTPTQTLLQQLGACLEAREWAGERTPEQAWHDCERGDWLLWLAARLDIDRKPLVLAACACARLALPYVPAGEQRPLAAIETAERWTRGEATIEQVRAAADAAYAAYASYASDADAAYAALAASAADADAAYAAAAYAARADLDFPALARQAYHWKDKGE